MSQAPTLAPCGINCTHCDIYRAAQDPAEAERLAANWRAGGNTEVTAAWFRCQGCFADRSRCWCDDCKIFACSSEKKLDHCGQCANFPCAVYTKWIGNFAHHRAAYERLQALKAK